MSLWEYMRSEVDNEIVEGNVNEAVALRRICKERWKMGNDEFARFVLFRRSRMRVTRTGRRTYLGVRRKKPEHFVPSDLLL